MDADKAKALLDFLDDQLEDCKRLQVGWCIFGIGVPAAMASSKAKAFEELESVLGIDGPFTNYKKECL